MMRNYKLWMEAPTFRGVPFPQPTSVFAEAYASGIHKTKYWEPVYEDSLNLIAKLPAIAAHIYRCVRLGHADQQTQKSTCQCCTEFVARHCRAKGQRHS